MGRNAKQKPARSRRSSSQPARNHTHAQKTGSKSSCFRSISPKSSGSQPSSRPRTQSSYTDRRSADRPRTQSSHADRSADYVEGRRACAEALDAAIPVSRAYVQREHDHPDQVLTKLTQRLGAQGVDIEYVPRSVLDNRSSHGAHQGIMLKVRPYQYAELSDIIAAAPSGDALIVVLDHVTDEGNFGAIVRTAEVVGAAGVIVPKARAARVGVGVYKTSAGAVMHLPIAQVANLASTLDTLKEHGFWAGAATEHAHDIIWDAPLRGRVALVMGSEGSGISRLVREHCDFEFRLPQQGKVESLNVAQATTAISYEWLRKCREASQGAAEQDG